MKTATGQSWGSATSGVQPTGGSQSGGSSPPAPENPNMPSTRTAMIDARRSQLGAPPLPGEPIAATHERTAPRSPRNHSTVDSIPSRNPMDAVQPAAVSLETSMSLRGVPSGLVVSHSVSPV